MPRKSSVSTARVRNYSHERELAAANAEELTQAGIDSLPDEMLQDMRFDSANDFEDVSPDRQKEISFEIEERCKMIRALHLKRMRAWNPEFDNRQE